MRRITLIRPSVLLLLFVGHVCDHSILRSVEQLVQQALPLLQEQFCDLIALRVLVADRPDALVRKAEDPRLGQPQQDGRVRGDD